MRQYLWYSPELNIIVFQSIMPECHIAFEWDFADMYGVQWAYNLEEDPMSRFLWIPLGEL